jgi:Ser/Thr protein kinase RdoA (MazF antagonist)
MMKLNLMTQFFETVDENWQSPIADQIASRWVDLTARVTCIRASANFVFKIEKDSQVYALRFNHENERTAAQIEAELVYINQLVKHGIVANKPIPSLQGNYVESVLTKLGKFHAVVFEALKGERLTLKEIDAERVLLWGKALGELHNASCGWRIDGRSGWKAQLSFARSNIPAGDGVLKNELNDVEKILSALPMNQENFGLIHFDFELDNIVWQPNGPGIIDFDDCAYCWYAADIVFALRDLFNDRVSGIDFNAQVFETFMDGYRLVRKMPDRELSNIPVLLRLNNLYSYGRVYRSIIEDPVEPEKEWARDLRKKLLRLLEKYQEEFQHFPIRSILEE